MKSKKCVVCKKRQLTNIECKCGKIVCIIHRYPDDHNCKFDNIIQIKKKLIEDNPKIVASKIENI